VDDGGRVVQVAQPRGVTRIVPADRVEARAFARRTQRAWIQRRVLLLDRGPLRAGQRGEQLLVGEGEQLPEAPAGLHGDVVAGDLDVAGEPAEQPGTAQAGAARLAVGRRGGGLAGAGTLALADARARFGGGAHAAASSPGSASWR
jgi:hypothetical protein